MINHVRTLLLNLRTSPTQVAGEEYISPLFTPAVLPTRLQAVRDALFGVRADRPSINLNLARLLAYLHTSPLVDDVFLDDSRITYNPARPSSDADPTSTSYNFVTAATIFQDDSAVFRRTSEAEARWIEYWSEPTIAAPLRAAALAMALAARTQDVLLGQYVG